jgi:hypothetical protein
MLADLSLKGCGEFDYLLRLAEEEFFIIAVLHGH